MVAAAPRCSAARIAFDLGTHFGQRIIDDRQVEVRQLPEPAVAAGDERLSLADVIGVEQSLVEIAFDHDRLEIIVDDELREHRIAADVSFARRVQRFGIESSR